MNIGWRLCFHQILVVPSSIASSTAFALEDREELEVLFDRKQLGSDGALECWLLPEIVVLQILLPKSSLVSFPSYFYEPKLIWLGRYIVFFTKNLTSKLDIILHCFK